MPSTAQSSHAGKKAPNKSKEGAPASEQPHRDNSGSARMLALMGLGLMNRSFPQGRRSAKSSSALHQESAAKIILTLCREAILHDGCDHTGTTITPSGKR
jgi:hypothetical protein